MLPALAARAIRLPPPVLGAFGVPLAFLTRFGFSAGASTGAPGVASTIESTVTVLSCAL